MNTASRRFSLVQLIAVTTATAAAIAFFSVLSWPPLGRSGLVEACVPGAILLAALWFCGRSFSGRMVGYAVVATGIAVLFAVKWVAASDWMFGHYHGPPPWIIVSSYSACVGVAASAAWFASRAVAWHRGMRADDEPPLRTGYLSATARVLGMGALTVVGGVLAAISGEDATKAWGQMDYYVEQRLLHDRLSVRQWAERLSKRDLPVREEMAVRMANQVPQPGDEAAIPTLAGLLDDDEAGVRRGAAETLGKLFSSASPGRPPTWANLDGAVLAGVVGALGDSDALVRMHIVRMLSPVVANGQAELATLPGTVVPALIRALDQPEPEVQRISLGVLSAMGPKASAAIEPLTAFMDKADPILRSQVTTTLARIQPESAVAVSRLAEALTKPYDAHARSMAARELGAMGPAARAAIPAFVDAWEKRMLTIEDAQAMYAIDPEAAANAGIPRAGGRP